MSAASVFDGESCTPSAAGVFHVALFLALVCTSDADCLSASLLLFSLTRGVEEAIGEEL